MVINTGAAIENISLSSVSDGTEKENPSYPLLFKASTIV